MRLKKLFYNAQCLFFKQVNKQVVKTKKWAVNNPPGTPTCALRRPLLKPSPICPRVPLRNANTGSSIHKTTSRWLYAHFYDRVDDVANEPAAHFASRQRRRVPPLHGGPRESVPGRASRSQPRRAATLRWRTLARWWPGPSAAGRDALFWFYSAFARRFVWCLVLDYCHSLAEGILRLKRPTRDSERVFRDFLRYFFFSARFERERRGNGAG